MINSIFRFPMTLCEVKTVYRRQDKTDEKKLIGLVELDILPRITLRDITPTIHEKTHIYQTYQVETRLAPVPVVWARIHCAGLGDAPPARAGAEEDNGLQQKLVALAQGAVVHIVLGQRSPIFLLFRLVLCLFSSQSILRGQAYLPFTTWGSS
jgi:hypothetical protein